MNKTMILEAMYETIMNSLEWSFDSELCEYPSYVDGVITMTATLLEKLNPPFTGEF